MKMEANNSQKEKIINKNLWIDWIQMLLIGFAAPFFLFPSIKYVWGFLIIPSIWVLRWAIKRQFFERTILDWAIAILSIQVFATCIIIPDIGFSLPKIAGVIFGIAFFYAMAGLLISEKFIKWGIFTFLGGGFILSVIGILGMTWSNELFLYKIIPKFSKMIPRIKWNLSGAEEGFNPNPLGGTLVLLIPLCLVLCFSYFKGKKENYIIANKIFGLTFFLFTVFVLCLVLFFTQSIGSWIGLLLTLWILPQTWKWKKAILGLTISCAVLVIFLNPVKNLIIGELSKNPQEKNKIEQRITCWSAGLAAINHHPIFGIGMNRIRLEPSVGYGGAHAHNHLLHTAAELGIPALIAYLALLIGAGYMCFEIWRKAKVGGMKIAAQGLGAGQLAHLIFGMGDSVPLGAKTSIFFWFSLGLIAAMYNLLILRKFRGEV